MACLSYPPTDMNDSDDFERFLTGDDDHRPDIPGQEDVQVMDEQGVMEEQGPEEAGDSHKEDETENRLISIMSAMHANMTKQLGKLASDFTTMHSRINEIESHQMAAANNNPEECINPDQVPDEVTEEGDQANLLDILKEAAASAPGQSQAETEESSTTAATATDEGDILAEFLKQAETEELTDEELEPRVANILNTLFRKKMDKEKYRKLMDDISTARPKNCEALAQVTTNPMLWATLSEANKTQDRKLQSYQKELLKASAILSKIFNMLVSAKGDSTALKIIDMLKMMNNALALLGDLNFNLVMFRRNSIKPDLKPCYQKLCSETVPFSKELFGDDLAKLVKDAGEVSKLSKKVGSGPNTNSFRGKAQSSYKNHQNRFDPFNNYNRNTRGGARGNGRGQTFFGKRRGTKPSK